MEDVFEDGEGDEGMQVMLATMSVTLAVEALSNAPFPSSLWPITFVAHLCKASGQTAEHTKWVWSHVSTYAFLGNTSFNRNKLARGILVIYWRYTGDIGRGR